MSCHDHPVFSFPQVSHVTSLFRNAALISALFLIQGTISAQTSNNILSLSSTSNSSSGNQRVSGPWGTLEIFPIILEPPSTHLWEALYDETTVWNFGLTPREEVPALLESLGILPETANAAVATGTWLQTAESSNQIQITDATVEALTPENRTALSRWFRLNLPDFFGRLVVNIDGGDFRAFDNDAVAPETLELVKRLSFKRKNVLSLMDRPYVMRKLGDNQEEKDRFLRSVFATRGLMARLVIDENSDLDSMIKYWSADGLNPDVEPVLRAVNTTNGVERVDLVQILPPIPKRYLNSFVNLRDVTPTNTPDCFWTSIQFFNAVPTSRLLDPLSIEHYLGSDFTKVDGEPRFGDLVCMFEEESGAFLHSYVHIAHDIVFSKNGASFARPFILTSLSDMLSVYLDETPYRYEVYRRKNGF